jgi:threonyl-tRNA synthetase
MDWCLFFSMVQRKTTNNPVTAPDSLKVIFPDGTEGFFSRDVTFRDVISGFAGSQSESMVAVKVNGILMGMGQRLGEAADIQGALTLETLSFESSDAKEVYRHSSAHMMAQAVKELFPSAKLAIGPAIEDGFYYDFDLGRPFTPEDLERVEHRMQEIVKEDRPFQRIELPKEEAIAFFLEKEEPYKVEMIQSFPDKETVTLYRQGAFVDLCRGPHVYSTGNIKAFKLLSSSGAYWRGDERNSMLQRIYGSSFQTQDELEAYLARQEEIRRRDHRRLGRELDLYSVQDEIGPGLILWHPKGAKIRMIIEDFFREQHQKHGYDFVFTPHIARQDLWRRSGHLEFYRENMFPSISVEDLDYQLKPMNCPFHIMIYQTHLRSYRDLPIRLTELGTVYRYERSGVLHGCLRVRGFTQDDAHIFCRPDQIESEITKALDLAFVTLKTFGFDEYQIHISTRPDVAVGSPENWRQATEALEASLKSHGMVYEIDPGEGVFYGPKIDLKIKDGLGRSWQCATIQVDFNLPERFRLRFIGEDSQAHPPIMIHRALMGSLERFFGVLIEHYAGVFPLWLAPVQVKILPITDRQHSYAQEVARMLSDQNLRVELDLRNEKIGLKIREAELSKVPYMVIMGGRETENRTLSVRKRSGEQLGAIQIDSFVQRLQQEVRDRIIK